jgi:hypothetical protein
LVGTNITGTASGFTAGSVTTNANLTGPITSVGNATTIVGPIPAVTLSGTISGAGNQINNVIIGTVTPLAGSFTAITGSSDATINGVTVGKGLASGALNTAVGVSALAANTTGAAVVAIGSQALKANTTGNDNTVIGRDAGLANTTGSSLSALGQGALLVNTTGSNNTAIGSEALRSNTTASNNTAVGYQAGYLNTAGTELTILGAGAGYNITGSYNSAIGRSAGASISTGTYNTAVGWQAMFNTNSNYVTGSYNTGVGPSALANVTSGNNNTSVGYQALTANLTASNNTAVGMTALYSNTASNNTAVGFQAGYTNTSGTIAAFGYNALSSNETGTNNAAFGNQALTTNSTGSSNTSVGFQSLLFNTTASNNTAVGYQAGYANQSSTDNTFLGYRAGLAVSTGTGRGVFIGSSAGLATTTGLDNVMVGYQTGATNISGGSNVYIGGGSFGNTQPAGYLATGSKNTFVGYSAGASVTTGAANVILGGYTGSAAPISATGNNYIVLSDGDGNVRQTIDGSGNVGIGTTAPARKLNVRSSGVMFANNGGEHTLLLGDEAYAYWGLYTPASPTYLSFQYNTVEKMKVDSSGNLTLAGNLSVADTVAAVTSATPSLYLNKVGTRGWSVRNTGNLGFYSHETATDLMLLDSSGNLGLGVTPSAWNTSFKAIQMAGGGAAIMSITGNAYYLNNTYFNSSNQFIYTASDYATQYNQAGGNHTWYTAASGTAGNPVTFTEVMKIDLSSNVTQTLGAGGSSLIKSVTYSNLGIIGTSDGRTGGGSQLNFTTTGHRDWVVGQRNDTAYAADSAFFIRDETAAATRLTIDTSGNVGIGTSSPGVKLDVSYLDTAYNPGIRVKNTSNNLASQAKVYVVNDADQYFSLGRNSTLLGSASVLFSTGAYPIDFYTNSTQAMTLDASSNLSIVGNITPSTAAKGINFTANTAAAGMTSQLLNWYEEGTWTPTFTSLTVVGTPTYTARYTRIGNTVTVCIKITSTGSTTSTYGGTTLDNLPFAQNASVRGNLPFLVDASGANGICTIAPSSTVIYCGAWTTAVTVFISGSYFV